jgi:large subunit ribosomal protein L21
MYAVIANGGKQYRVQPGMTIKLEKIEAEPGEALVFDQVLLVGQGAECRVGQPFIDGVSVKAEVQSHGRAAKISMIKIKRRKHHMKRQGHRQYFTEVKVTEIVG